MDHFSRMVTAVCPLEGPNAGWVVDVLETAFLRHGSPKHIITDQEGVFISSVFAELLRQWNVKQRFGGVGRHGSIAVTERAILTLKQEWLRRVPVIRGMDHLGQLLDDFSEVLQCATRRALRISECGGYAVRAAMPPHRLRPTWQAADKEEEAV